MPVFLHYSPSHSADQRRRTDMLINSTPVRLPVLADQARRAILAGLIFSFIQVADASPIVVSLGPPRTITSQTPSSPFDALNGTPLDGQSLSVEFSFSDNEFARVFSVTSDDFQAVIK